MNVHPKKRSRHSSEEYHMLSCLSFSSIIFKDRYRQSRNPFPRILRQCFHGGPRPRSISRSPIVDRERRLDASNLLRGSQRTSRQKQGKRLASLAYRVWIFPLPFLLLFLPFFLFFFFLFFFTWGPDRSSVILATLIISTASRP